MLTKYHSYISAVTLPKIFNKYFFHFFLYIMEACGICENRPDWTSSNKTKTTVGNNNNLLDNRDHVTFELFDLALMVVSRLGLIENVALTLTRLIFFHSN